MTKAKANAVEAECKRDRTGDMMVNKNQETIDKGDKVKL